MGFNDRGKRVLMTEETLTVAATKTFTSEISEAATVAPEKCTRLFCSDYLTTRVETEVPFK